MGEDREFVGVVDGPVIHDSQILSVSEQDDSISVILRRRSHRGQKVGRASPRIRVHFESVKDISARSEVGMIICSLAEMRGEAPWRRFVFTNWDDDDDAYLAILAQDVEWSDVGRHPCPCCGYRTLDEFPPGTDEICGSCDWQDDVVQSREPDFGAGPTKERVSMSGKLTSLKGSQGNLG
jgi:hypothetical protein